MIKKILSIKKHLSVQTVRCFLLTIFPHYNFKIPFAPNIIIFTYIGKMDKKNNNTIVEHYKKQTTSKDCPPYYKDGKFETSG